MTIIWATRGKDWGFRFLEKGGLIDPLSTYEEAFAGVDYDPKAHQVIGSAGPLTDAVAVRFPDPQGRKDAAGRVIPHELVLADNVAGNIQATDVRSVEDCLRLVWPLLEERYAAIWDQPTPPSS